MLTPKKIDALLMYYQIKVTDEEEQARLHALLQYVFAAGSNLYVLKVSYKDV